MLKLARRKLGRCESEKASAWLQEAEQAVGFVCGVREGLESFEKADFALFAPKLKGQQMAGPTFLLLLSRWGELLLILSAALDFNLLTP